MKILKIRYRVFFSLPSPHPQTEKVSDSPLRKSQNCSSSKWQRKKEKVKKYPNCFFLYKDLFSLQGYFEILTYSYQFDIDLRYSNYSKDWRVFKLKKHSSVANILPSPAPQNRQICDRQISPNLSHPPTYGSKQTTPNNIMDSFPESKTIKGFHIYEV